MISQENTSSWPDIIISSTYGLYHALGSMLTPMHVLCWFILMQPCEAGVHIVPISQMRKAKHSVSSRAEI